MNAAAMKVSVVFTVLNDVGGVAALLDALVGQTRPPDEIVAVDGGSTDGTLEALACVDTGDIPLRLLHRAGVNIAAGRNVGIEAAEHDLIACTDAGCIPDQNWLAELSRPFDDARIAVVGGNYRISPRTACERVVGLLTMPGQLKAIEPARFNPSARSIAFRRGAWRRAGGFPEWLYTAEDTLFDCKLRRNGEWFVFAEHAIVRWRPRSGLRSVWRQFRNYARGESRIGRGAETARFWRRRFAIAGALGGVAAAAGILGWGADVALLALGAGGVWLGRPTHRLAADIARYTGRPLDYLATHLLNPLIAWANVRGHRRGERDRRRDTERYVKPMVAYWGADAVASVPAWRMVDPPTPRTLIVAWHWPPANRASTNVLSNLFVHAPADSFHVLARAVAATGADPVAVPGLPTAYVAWPTRDEREGTLRTWLASMRTTRRMVRAARRLHRETPFQRIIAVYPHRYGVLAGWLIARQTDVPLVMYMHDLFAETSIAHNPAKRRFWAWVDRAALAAASLIITPTAAFAEHYRSRGLTRTWVLPHCRPADVQPSDPPKHPGPLRVLYTGNIYQAHADAVAALVQAGKLVDDVDLRFLCNANPLVPDDARAWVSRAEAWSRMHTADVLVVALGRDTPYPVEINGCFPSKIVDYLAVGRPILAIVPAGSFVDGFVRATGCGVSVTSGDPVDVARVLDMMQDRRVRVEMAEAARRVAVQLDGRRWMRLLCERLALGAPDDPATPPFPALENGESRRKQRNEQGELTGQKSGVRGRKRLHTSDF